MSTTRGEFVCQLILNLAKDGHLGTAEDTYKYVDDLCNKLENHNHAPWFTQYQGPEWNEMVIRVAMWHAVRKQSGTLTPEMVTKKFPQLDSEQARVILHAISHVGK